MSQCMDGLGTFMQRTSSPYSKYRILRKKGRELAAVVSASDWRLKRLMSWGRYPVGTVSLPVCFCHNDGFLNYLCLFNLWSSYKFTTDALVWLEEMTTCIIILICFFFQEYLSYYSSKQMSSGDIITQDCLDRPIWWLIDKMKMVTLIVSAKLGWGG